MSDLGAVDFQAKGGAIQSFGSDTVLAKEQQIRAAKDRRAFGSTAGSGLAAGFDISQVGVQLASFIGPSMIVFGGYLVSWIIQKKSSLIAVCLHLSLSLSLGRCIDLFLGSLDVAQRCPACTRADPSGSSTTPTTSETASPRLRTPTSHGQSFSQSVMSATDKHIRAILNVVPLRNESSLRFIFTFLPMNP